MSSNLKLAFVIEAFDNATGKLKAINKAVEKSREPWLKVRASAREFFNEAGWGKLQRNLDSVRTRGAAVASWGRQAAGVMLGLGTAAATGLFGMQRMADSVDRINDAAQGLGVSTQQLQQVGFAAKMNGSSLDEMAQSLMFMNKNMAEARDGNADMVLWMRRAGISTTDLKNRNFTAIDALHRLADTFKNVGDKGDNAQKKIAVTTHLLGRQGFKMTQLLNGGSAAMRAYYAEADRVGAVLSEDTVKAMTDFNDSADKMKMTLFGAIATALGPAAKLLGGIGQKIVEWTVANRAMMASKFEVWIWKIEAALPTILQGFESAGELMVSFASAADRAANAVGGWTNALIAISTLIAAKFVLDLVMLGVTVGTLIFKFVAFTKIIGLIAAGFAAATLPVWLLVGALVAAAAVVMAHWEPISKFFSGLWAKIEGLSGAGARLFGLGPAAGGAAGSSVAGATPSAIPAGGLNRVGGELRIAITGAPARVESMQKTKGSLLDLSVDTGPTLSGAY